MPSIVSLREPSVRAWVDGETYTPQKQNSDDRNLRTGIADLNSAIADVEKNFSSSSQPLSKPQGKHWYDSGNSILKLYHQTSGTPVGLLTKENAYSQSLSTAGTATFKPGGAIDVNTTQVSRSGAGNLMSYTTPANTASVNGQIIQNLSFGGTSLIHNRSLSFGGQTLFTTGYDGGSYGDYFFKCFLVRSSATSVRFFAICKQIADANADASAAGDSNVFQGTATVDFTANQVLQWAAVSAGTQTQEIMLTRYLP